MIDLIRASAVPANLVQSAARGALSIPPEEMIEILVYLATKNKVFAERARLTLAGWDEVSSQAAAADPRCPKEVLEYLIDPENLRPVLLPALLENPSVPDETIVKLAASSSRSIAETILESKRVNRSRTILAALGLNPNLTEVQSSAVTEKALSLEPETAKETAKQSGPTPSESFPETVISEPIPPAAVFHESSEPGEQEVPDEVVAVFMTEHEAEILAEAAKPFEPVGDIHEESHPDDPGEALAESIHAVAATPSAGSAAAAPQRAPVHKKSFLGAGHEKGSALQKIAKLDIKGRIQLAMKGTKEERSLLIRDGTKIVALAVLESPKLTDGEVEKFASQKNVLESVLRAIPMKRRFVKLYPVVRNLVFNPRTPIDVSLGLIKHLLTQDLRHLAGNKEVSDTVRKLALKMFKQKLDTTKKS